MSSSRDHEQTAGIALVWRAIDSAPKDGTKVLGFAPHPLIKDPAFRVVSMWWRKYTVREGDRWSWQSTENGSHVGDPTHWMPLPAPPSSAEPALGDRSRDDQSLTEPLSDTLSKKEG